MGCVPQPTPTTNPNTSAVYYPLYYSSFMLMGLVKGTILERCFSCLKPISYLQGKMHRGRGVWNLCRADTSAGGLRLKWRALSLHVDINSTTTSTSPRNAAHNIEFVN